MTFYRGYRAELATGDGRTVEGCCVPYNVAATVNDGTGPYVEMFAPGCFAAMVGSPQRVLFSFEHSGLVANTIGHATHLAERPDGLYGTFRVVDGATGDQALALVRSRVLGHLSVGFVPLGPGRRGPRGEKVRTACHLDEVSLCREPSYVGADVLAVRSRRHSMSIAALRPPPLDPVLETRLRLLGIRARR